MTAPAKTAAAAPRSWWADNWRPLLVVLAVGLLPFLAVLLSGNILFASDQMGSPAWEWYFKGLRRGEIPRWDPFFLSGMPTHDANAGSSLYLPTLILGFLLPVTRFITWDFVLHTLLAGGTAYLLVRRYFGVDRWISAALGAAYMLNTNFISLIFGGHEGKFHILAWLPLSLYFLLRALGPSANWRHLVGLALSIAIFITTSHLQFTYFVLMGFFFVWLYFTLPALFGRRVKEAGSVTLRYWVPVLLGIGLVFFVLYPPVQYNKEFSVRGAGTRTTYEHATSWSMHPEETASLLVPEFGGLNENYWGRNYFKLNSEYPGLTAWFLGLLGLIAFRRSRWFWLWGGVGLLAVIYGLGAHTPLFRLFYEFIPGVRVFRAPSMMLFWLAAALLMMGAEALRRLTAVGKDALPDMERARIHKGLRIAGFSAAGVLALAGLMPGAVYGLWGSLVDGSQIMNLPRQAAASPAFALGALRAASLTLILTWAVGAFLLKTRRPAVFGLVALAVTVADLYWVNTRFIQGIPTERLLRHDPAVDVLKSDASRFRVFGLPGTFEGVNTRYHGIETVDGFADHEMRHYRQFRGYDYQNNPNLVAGLRQAPDGTLSGNVFLDMLNVKYVAFRVPDYPGIQLARNASALPRAWFVTRWEAVSDSGAWYGIRDAGFDPRRVAYVTAPGLSSGGSPADSATEGVATVAQTIRRYNRETYVVDVPSEGLLVLSEIWFPHWRVKVDGQPSSILRTNFAFRGVLLKPGRHEIEFHFSSPWMRKGLLVSGIAFACLAGISLLGLSGRFRGLRPGR